MDEEITDTTTKDGAENHHHKIETSDGDDVFDGAAEDCPFCKPTE